MRNMARFFGAALLTAASVALAAPGDSPLVQPNTALLAGTDDLGRSLPSYAQTGGPKPDRYVGMFYWQWHNGLRSIPGQYNMTQYLKTHPKEMNYYANPPGGPKNPTYYWGQPIFGYYRSTDPWVMRKQLSLFGEMGIDFLFFDYTNSEIYNKQLATFLKVRQDLKSKGLEVPRITFFLNYQPEWKIEALYTKWYKPGKYKDAWFRFKGKPLLMAAMPTDASKFKNPKLLPEIQKYFTWRKTWALGNVKDPHEWRFMDSGKLKPAIGPDGKIEQAVVNKSMGGPIWDNFAKGGVSALPGSHYTAADYNGGWCLPTVAKGLFFQHGWNQAMHIAPPILLLTGWNEWTASVWNHPGVTMLGRTTKGKESYIVDEYNMQFDRDIEPMHDGYGDDYFMQALENLRRYKGMVRPQPISHAQTIDINGPQSQWADITPVYHDTVGDVADRNWDGNIKGMHYTNNSARNDIATAQVTYDAKTVFFHVTTAAPLSPSTDANWMELFIDSHYNMRSNADVGWHGFDLLINRTRKGNTASVERSVGQGWNWQKVTNVPMHIEGNHLTIAVPRGMLGGPELNFNFKWADNLPTKPTIDDFYTQGDAAPDGRLSYRFNLNQ